MSETIPPTSDEVGQARRYELGQPVRFTRNLYRKRVYPQTGYGKWRSEWQPYAYLGEREPAPRDGIVIGVRTLRNGDCVILGYDEPIVFRGTESVTAYLIAFDIRRAPVLCLPEHVEAR